MVEYVVVTGASSGIGKALAVHLADEGYHVLAIGRNEIALHNIKSSAQAKKNITTVVADLSHNGIDKVVKTFNKEDRIKYLVHCAAVIEPLSPLMDAEEDELTNAMQVNTITPITLTKKLKLYFMPDTRVMFMGTDLANPEKSFTPGLAAAYSISKAALEVAVTYLRREVSFSITYCKPGLVDTPMLQTFMDAFNKPSGSSSAAMQSSSPQEIAKLLLILLKHTPQAEFVSTDWNLGDEGHRDLLSKHVPVSQVTPPLPDRKTVGLEM
jgi:NAD(P)-dependent dehydrogenase (short-subunit alcohol dehydrogenase family)